MFFSTLPHDFPRNVSRNDVKNCLQCMLLKETNRQLFSKNLLIKSFFVNSENFKMEVEQMYFVSHLIITVQYIIDYLKTRLLKFGQISFKW